jgi:hypothetical protein
VKLIFCPSCEDMFKLQASRRYCDCGESWGYYLPDGLNAVISDGSVPIGIENVSFASALIKKDIETETGTRFTAFLIPPSAKTIKRSSSIVTRPVSPSQEDVPPPETAEEIRNGRLIISFSYLLCSDPKSTIDEAAITAHALRCSAEEIQFTCRFDPETSSWVYVFIHGTDRCPATIEIPFDHVER